MHAVDREQLPAFCALWPVSLWSSPNTWYSETRRANGKWQRRGATSVPNESRSACCQRLLGVSTLLWEYFNCHSYNRSKKRTYVGKIDRQDRYEKPQIVTPHNHDTIYLREYWRPSYYSESEVTLPETRRQPKETESCCRSPCKWQKHCSKEE